MQLEEIIAERNEKDQKAKWDFLFDPNVYCLAIFFVLMMVMMLTGCNDRGKQKPGEPTTENQETKAELSTEVVPLPEPDKYEVRLKWRHTQGYPPRGWFIRRMDRETGEEKAAFREAQATSFRDEWVTAGKNYHYTFGTIEDPGGSVVKVETHVTIPKDLEINGTMELDSVSKINRVFLRPNSNLITNGKDFTMEVNEIHSQDGAIRTFLEGQMPSSGVDGRNGGTITIRAKRGSGALSVVGSGENGGNGANGVVGGTGRKGAAGKIGLGTHEIVPVVCNCEKRARELQEQIKELPSPSGVVATLQWTIEQRRHRCISEPTDGAPGEQGGAGQIGGNGGAGGDSAQVFVKIADSSGFTVNASSNPGRGGAPGNGGEGGTGGSGGDAGDRVLDFFKVCHEAKGGPMGAKGERGLPGRPGRDGKKNPMCVILGTTEFGACGSFPKDVKEGGEHE